MKIGKRGWAVAGGSLVVVLAAGWFAFDRYAIQLPAMIMDWRDPIGPNRVVEWERGPDAPSAPAESRPPNIVLIVADDLGWNDLTVNGGGVAGGTVPTPHIDSIAKSGLVLSHGYSGSGTCAPSRAAMMSGRYPTRFGFEFTPMPPGMARITTRFAAEDKNALRQTVLRDAEGPELDYTEMGMPQSEISMGNLLQEAGYRTIHIGKWHLGETNGMAAYDQGFDESLLMASGLYLNLDDPASVEARNDFDPIDRFLWANMRFAARKNGGPRFAPDRYLTDYFTNEAVKAIEANRNRPFFLYLAHWAPHTPLQATQEDYDALSHIEDHTLRVYGAMIRALDRGVGEVLDALKENGLEENTLVIFTSDNGGAHYIGLPEINQPYRGWKATFFGGGIRVPFFLKWPAKIEAGQVYDHPVHHFDLYATAAAVAGVPVPDDRIVDGRNLLTVLEDAENPLHETLFWRSGHYQTVLHRGWKLQRTERPDAVWLFDLDNDPTEQNNLAARRPEKVAELVALLDAHNAEQAEPGWPSRVEMPVSIDKSLRERQAEDDEYIYWPN